MSATKASTSERHLHLNSEMLLSFVVAHCATVFFCCCCSTRSAFIPYDLLFIIAYSFRTNDAITPRHFVSLRSATPCTSPALRKANYYNKEIRKIHRRRIINSVSSCNAGEKWAIPSSVVIVSCAHKQSNESTTYVTNFTNGPVDKLVRPSSMGLRIQAFCVKRNVIEVVCSICRCRNSLAFDQSVGYVILLRY